MINLILAFVLVIVGAVLAFVGYSAKYEVQAKPNYLLLVLGIVSLCGAVFFFFTDPFAPPAEVIPEPELSALTILFNNNEYSFSDDPALEKMANDLYYAPPFSGTEELSSEVIEVKGALNGVSFTIRNGSNDYYPWFIDFGDKKAMLDTKEFCLSLASLVEKRNPSEGNVFREGCENYSTCLGDCLEVN